MNLLVLPTRMGALASNASAALRLLSNTKRYDEMVLKGLQQAKQFCEVLNTGNTIKAGADHFSADGYRARRFVDLVCKLPNGEELAKRSTTVTTDLETLISMARPGDAASEEALRVSQQLRNYFSEFSRYLPYYENMRRRMAAEMPRNA